MMSATYPTNAVFSAQAVSQQKGGRWLFQPVSFQLNPGEILYVQGVNGAGKTTLLKALIGLTVPAIGEVRWNGQVIQTCWQSFAKERMFLGHQDGLRRGLTVQENLELGFYLGQGRHLAQETLRNNLELIGLADKADAHIDTLSAGQRRRIGLGRLFMSNAQLWVLDEPLTALDAAGSKIFYTQLQAHLAQNGMVVMTSHQALQMPHLPIKDLSLQVIT